MKRNARILLTGGTGLLGSALAGHLRQLGADVSAPSHADGDLRDTDFCKKILSGVDHVFHLASFRRNVAYHLKHRDEVIENNLAMTDALSSALLDSKKSIPVTFFSTAILGTYARGQNARSLEMEKIEDGYAAGKLHCEYRWQEVCAQLKSPLLIVRPASAYGPGDNFGADANVIPSLIKKCSEGKYSFTVWGSGKQLRSFLYANDVGPALMELIDGNVTGMQYLCPPERVSIGKLAEMIRDLMKPEMKIVFDASKPEGPSFPPMPLNPLLKNFHWTPLKTGLQKTVDWYHKNV